MNAPNRIARKETRPEMIVSARKGIQCYFDVDDFTISVWGSAWTGREIAKVDDRVVSSKLSIRFSTTHDFEHRGHRYRVRFIIASMATGLARIELYRDGELIDFDEARRRSIKIDPATGKIDWRAGWKAIIGWAVVGGLFGAALGYAAAELVERWLS